MALFSKTRKTSELDGCVIETVYHQDGTPELQIVLPDKVANFGGSIGIEIGTKIRSKVVGPKILFQKEINSGTSRKIRFKVPQLDFLKRSGYDIKKTKLVFRSGKLKLSSEFDLPERLVPNFKPVIVSQVGTSGFEGDVGSGLRTNNLTSSFTIMNPNDISLSFSVFKRNRSNNSGYFDVVEDFETVEQDVEVGPFEVFVVRDVSGLATTDYFVRGPDGSVQIVTKAGTFREKEHASRVGASKRSSFKLQPKVLFVQEYSGTQLLFKNLTKDIAFIQVYRSGRLLFEKENLGESVSFFDDDAQISGRRYTYEFVLLGKRGERKTFSDSFVRYGKPFDKDLLFEVKEVKRTDSSREFEVKLQITEKGIDRFTQQLPGEFVQTFSEDLGDLRSFITNLLFFEVSKTNLKTFESQSLGVFSKGNEESVKFVDEGADSLGEFVYLFTPIVITPVSALERSAQKGEVDDISQKLERFRRFFSSLVKNWNALPSRSRVSPNAEGVVSFLLAPGREEQTSKVAVQRFVESGAAFEEKVKLLNLGFDLGVRRIGSSFEDVIVKYEFNELPLDVVQVRLFDLTGQNVLKREFLLSSSKGQVILPSVDFDVNRVEMRVI
jgi:hypothetical protein